MKEIIQQLEGEKRLKPHKHSTLCGKHGCEHAKYCERHMYKWFEESDWNAALDRAIEIIKANDKDDE